MEISAGFVLLSLFKDPVKEEQVSQLCLEYGITYKNSLDRMELLEDVLDHEVRVIIFGLGLGVEEVTSSMQLLKEDSFSQDIPLIIITELEDTDSLALEVKDYPVISIFTYKNWKYQLAMLIQVLIHQYSQARHLHHELASTKEINILDPLTGALNRRGCQKKFESLVGYHASNDEGICLVMLDIDHFKKVNDTYGHDIGDEVLVEISQLLKESIRKADTLVRFGGEEFILLLSNCSLQGGIEKAEGIRQEIEESVVSSRRLHVTSSFGVVEYFPGYSLDYMIQQADTLLYKAKSEGRNRVCYPLMDED